MEYNLTLDDGTNVLLYLDTEHLWSSFVRDAEKCSNIRQIVGVVDKYKFHIEDCIGASYDD